MVGSKTPGKLVEDVVITIPLSKAVSSTSLTSNIGQVRFDDMTKVNHILKTRQLSISLTITYTHYADSEMDYWQTA